MPFSLSGTNMMAHVLFQEYSNVSLTHKFYRHANAIGHSMIWSECTVQINNKKVIIYGLSNHPCTCKVCLLCAFYLIIKASFKRYCTTVLDIELRIFSGWSDGNDLVINGGIQASWCVLINC